MNHNHEWRKYMNKILITWIFITFILLFILTNILDFFHAFSIFYLFAGGIASGLSSIITILIYLLTDIPKKDK